MKSVCLFCGRLFSDVISRAAHQALQQHLHAIPSSKYARCESAPLPEANQLSDARLERAYVHRVYDEIAAHFSHTRYQRWPRVEQFLATFSAGSLIADVGCGNGKYLGANPSCFFTGCDMSRGLLQICNRRGFEVAACDNLQLPYRTDTFDGVISIAVLHHLVSAKRRLAAFTELVRVLRPGGRALVYVWSFEEGGRCKGQPATRQDAYIPWTLPKRYAVRPAPQPQPLPQAPPYQPSTANIEGHGHNSGFAAVPGQTQSGGLNIDQGTKLNKGKFDYRFQQTSFLRFYHLFKEGELPELVNQCPDVNVLEAGFDHQNWFVVVEKNH